MQAIKTTGEKYKNLSVQTKAALWFAICSVLQKGISFVTVPIFTRIMPSEDYGVYTLYLSWLQIMTIITTLNLHCGVFNNGMTKFEEDRDRYISSMQGITITLTTIVLVIFSVGLDSWSKLLGLAPGIILLMFIELYTVPAFNFWSGKLRFEYRYKILVTFTLVKSVLNPLLGFVLVLVSTDKGLARVVSIVSIEAVFCGTLLIRQFARGKVFFDSKYWKYALTLALPVLPHYLSGVILNQGDRVMIDKMAGKSAVAFYGVAYSIGMLTQIVSGAIIDSFTPWMYMKIKRKDFDQVKYVINYIMLFVMAVVFLLMLFGPEVIMIFGSSEYAEAKYVIPPVAASVFFIFLYNIIVIPEFYFEKTQYLMISSLIAAGLNIALNYIFIKQYGYIAAAYTTLACYILYGVGHFIIVKRITGKEIPGIRLYDTRTIGLIGLFVVMFGIAIQFIYDNLLIRMALVLATMITIYINKDRIINLFKTIRSK